MNPDAPPPAGLTGQILVASPALQDPNFAQTLIYIAQHTREGAVGVVVNRPTGKVLGDTSGVGPFPDAMRQIPLLVGGPVNPSFVTIGVFRPGEKDREWACSFSENPGKIAKLLASTSATRVRAFAGYSGWSGGQLENELQEGAWKVAAPSRALFEPHWAAGLWPCYASGRESWRDLLDFLPERTGLN